MSSVIGEEPLVAAVRRDEFFDHGSAPLRMTETTQTTKQLRWLSRFCLFVLTSPPFLFSTSATITKVTNHGFEFGDGFGGEVLRFGQFVGVFGRAVLEPVVSRW